MVRHNRVLSVVASFVFFCFLAGCVDAPPMSLSLPDLTFSQMETIPLDVGRIDVVETYKPPGTGIFVEHEFSTPPMTAARRLVESKLLPRGPAGRVLSVYIEDASVRMEKLPVRDGFAGIFVREPSERYIARVSLRFEMTEATDPGTVIARAHVGSDRISTIQENASLSERDQAYLRLTEDLMRDLYQGFQSVVQGSFGRAG